MLRFDINQAKSFFFTGEIARKVDAGTRRVLSIFGYRVRRTARRSLRKRKRSAKPGRPPTMRQGLIKRFLFFVFDPFAKSVVTGPAKLNAVAYDDTLEVLEHGGVTSRTARGRKVRVDYSPHPFMQPAFEKELPGVDDLWSNAIR